MYKHAIAWRASFVETSPKTLRPQLLHARAVAASARAIAVSLGLTPPKDSKKKSRKGSAAKSQSQPSKAVSPAKLIRANAKAAPLVVDGKLQAELQKYLAAVLH